MVHGEDMEHTNDFFEYVREQREANAIDGWAQEHKTADDAAESAVRSLVELSHTIQDLPVSDEQTDPTEYQVLEGEDRELLQADARLVTWHEDEHHHLGYGLALLPPTDGLIEGRMYSVELRRLPRIVHEHDIEVRAGVNAEIHKQAEDLADEVSKDELDILAAMAHKALLASRGEVHTNNFKILQLIKTETDDHSSLNVPEEKYYPENIYEAGIESMARSAVRQHLGYHEYRKRGLTSLCLKHELRDTTYYVQIDTTRSALSSAEREIKEIRMLSISKDSEILVYPPDPTIDYSDELIDLAYDVEGIADTFAHGEPQDSVGAREFDLEWKLAKLRVEHSDPDSPSDIEEL